MFRLILGGIWVFITFLGLYNSVRDGELGMSLVLTLIFVGACVVIYKTMYEETEKGQGKEHVMESLCTRDLFLDTLTKIGCQYELAEEEGNNRIFFAYQGEHFIADTTNEGWYVHVWDTHWEHVELYDVDELSRLKKAINYSNLNCATMTVYTIDEAGSNVDVHCKSTFPFLPQIPNIENYLRGELNDFFRAHQLVGNEMAKLREQEKC